MREQEIRSIILEVLNKPDVVEFTNEMELGMDSIDFVRVVIALEDGMEVEFDEFDLNLESFKTCNDFIKYIDALLN